MAPHLSDAELDYVFVLKDKGLAPTAIHKKLVDKRSKKGSKAPSLSRIRRALKGKTYKRGKVETRGRPGIFTLKKLRAMNATRKTLIKKAKGEKEIHWDDVLRASRVQCCPSTLAKRLRMPVLTSRQGSHARSHCGTLRTLQRGSGYAAVGVICQPVIGTTKYI